MSPTRILAVALAVAAVLAGRSVLAGEARADGSGPKAPPAVHLRVVATTTIEVALAWDAVPAATSYVLQRSTSPSFDPASTVAFELPPGVTGYGDLGCGPYEASRFGPGHHVKEFDRQNAYLRPGQVGGNSMLYYRLKARLKAGQELTSAAVSARLAGKPLRGESGDLWADVVLGQPDFRNYNYGKLTAHNVRLAGGLAIDRATKPNRVYILDGCNNRVLGLDRLGVSSATSRPATSEADCPPGERLLLMPGQVAQRSCSASRARTPPPLTGTQRCKPFPARRRRAGPRWPSAAAAPSAPAKRSCS